MGIIFRFVPMGTVVTVGAFQQGNADRTIDYSAAARKYITHEILQSGAGKNDDLGRFGGAHLGNLKRVVVKTGYITGDQLHGGKPGSLTQAIGELADGEGGCHNLRTRLSGGTAAGENQKDYKKKKYEIFFHITDLPWGARFLAG